MLTIYKSNLLIETGLKNFTLKIFDVYGQLMMANIFNDNNTVELNLNEFKTGIYILELESQEEQSHIKIHKE